MKLHFRSDIHLIVNEGKPMAAYPETDIIVVAGDIEDSDHLKVLALANPDKQYIGVLGNHDYWYTKERDIELAHLEYADDSISNLTILQNTAKTIHGIRFIGSCLWGHGGKTYIQARQLQNGLNDFVHMDNWTVEEMRKENAIARQFIEMELKYHHDNTVVITHFPPIMSVLDPKYQEDPSVITECYYNGGMDWEINKLAENKHMPKLWIFGHSHSKVDETIAGTRFMSNCRGYEGYEMPYLNPDLIVEV